MDPAAPTAEPLDDQPTTQDEVTGDRAPFDDDRIVGGVCGFLAAQLGVDALWVRIGFVLLALAGGIGVVVYAGLWLVLSADRLTSWRWQRVIGGALLIVGLPLLLNGQVGQFITGPIAVILLLAGLALALWRPPAPRRQLAAWTHARPGPLDRAPEPSAVLDEPRPAQRSPRLRRPRPEPSILGRATLGIAIVISAVGALIDQTNGGRLHPEQWLGLSAVACGLGLVVGAVRGHARWLIVPALVFAGAGYTAGIAARLHIDASDGLGNRWLWIDSTQPGGRVTERTGIGNVDIQVDSAPDERLVVDARVGIGDVTVRPNEDIAIEVRTRTDDGIVSVNGVRRGDGTVHIGPEGSPAVIIEAWVARGDVRIETFTPAPMFPLEPPAIELDIPQLDAPLAAVTDAVAVTNDGWFVLAGGTAVIDPDDNVIVGEQYPSGSGVTTIMTPYGDFQLLPRSLLISPSGEVLDLRAIRGELAAGTPTSTVPEIPLTTRPTTSTGD